MLTEARLRTLLHNALAIIKDGQFPEDEDAPFWEQFIEEDMGMTQDEASEVLECRDWYDYRDIDKFIKFQLTEFEYLNNNKDLSNDIASDIAYDLKSSFFESKFNPFVKGTEEDQEVFDDWFDDFAFEEIVPLLCLHGAKCETDDETDAIQGWLLKYCKPYHIADGLHIYKSNFENKFFRYDSLSEQPLKIYPL